MDEELKPEDFVPYVEEFIYTFGGSLDVRLWMRLVAEELLELKAELAHGNKLNALKELADLNYVIAGVFITCETGHLMPEEEQREHFVILDEARETVNACYKQFGFDTKTVFEAFQRVHDSNMSKLGEDGKPIRREDGKILKGSNYKAPDLKDLVE